MKRKLPPEAFEADFPSGWNVSKHHYSPEDCVKIEKFITDKVKLAREIAKRSKPRFVEIERTTRFTAYRNMLKQQEAEAVEWAKHYKPCPALLREQRRLIKTWRNK